MGHINYTYFHSNPWYRPSMEMNQRFRGFLPVVIDIETGGFDARRHAVLEIAAAYVQFRGDRLELAGSWQRAVQPYAGSQIEEASLKITGIDPDDPKRQAISEKEVLQSLFKDVRQQVKNQGCHRAIMVAHNAAFDQSFLHKMVERTDAKRSPFHPFTFMDTASLAAVAYGHTVLAQACSRAGISFAPDKAHSALYDATCTAELLCAIVNGFPHSPVQLTTGNGDSDYSNDYGADN